MLNPFQKENINHFYVGELNLGFNFVNPLEPHIVSKEYKEKVQSYYHALKMGAVSLENDSVFEKIDWSNNRLYKSIFTLFYKLDNGKYLCLHNGKTYSYLGYDYYENVRPLVDLFPKMDYYSANKITQYEALGLFRKALQHKLSDRMLYSIDNFYKGTIDLLVGTSLAETKEFQNNEYQNFNIMGQALLREVFKEPGITLVKNNHKYYYRKYDVILYKSRNGDLYNVNGNKGYKWYETKVMDRIIEVEKPLKDCLDERKIHRDEIVTIPKVLRLQKKILMDNRK